MSNKLNSLQIALLPNFQRSPHGSAALWLVDEKMAVSSKENQEEEVALFAGYLYFFSLLKECLVVERDHHLTWLKGLAYFLSQQAVEQGQPQSAMRLRQIIRLLRDQYAEDSSPAAHPPLRPVFATPEELHSTTILIKGAELHRMLFEQEGATQFMKILRLFIESHPIGAITIDDYVEAHEREIGSSLTSFKHWFTQAGTPTLSLSTTHDKVRRLSILTFKQECRHTSLESWLKHPLLIPLRLQLFDESGALLPSSLKLSMEKEELKATIKWSNHRPLIAFPQTLGARIRLNFNHSIKELEQLYQQDANPISRWQTWLKLMGKEVRSFLTAPDSHGGVVNYPSLIRAWSNILLSYSYTPDLKALLLEIPDPELMDEVLEFYQEKAVASAIEKVRRNLALAGRDLLLHHSLALLGRYSAPKEKELLDILRSYLYSVGDEAMDRLLEDRELIPMISSETSETEEEASSSTTDEALPLWSDESSFTMSVP